MRAKCCFEIFDEFRPLCCLNFMGQECAGIVPESSRCWQQHFYAVFTSPETIFRPTSLTISGATWAPTRLRPIKLKSETRFFKGLERRRCACQISKRYDISKYQSRGFETSRDLTIRRLFGYWDGAAAGHFSWASTWWRCLRCLP